MHHESLQSQDTTITIYHSQERILPTSSIEGEHVMMHLRLFKDHATSVSKDHFGNILVLIFTKTEWSLNYNKIYFACW